MRTGREPVDHDIALGFVDAHGHIEMALVQFFDQHLGIAVQPGNAGAVGGIDREIKRGAL